MCAIHWDALYHAPYQEYRHTLPDGRIVIRLQTGRDDFDQVELLAADMYGEGPSMDRAEATVMERAWQDGLHDCYQCVISRPDPRIHYMFRLTRDGQRYGYDQEALYPESQRPASGDITCFPYPWAYPAAKKPDWARGAVGYQIFPDRFRREAQDSEESVEPWSSTHYENECRFGGNLKGILKAVPYLSELGVDIVYMTPIFLSNSSHRYNTFDYYQVDPLLGTKEDLKALADALHARGMRLVLDGVFNHSGVAFAPFVDAKEKGKDSPFYNWFFFDDKWPCGYATFAHTPFMPKLNLADPQAAAYFMEVGRYWLRETGMDGWRLDVSPEVWPDFWRQFRKAVLAQNPDALIIAECWDDSRQWLNAGDMFDSTMNYVFSRAMWRFFAQKDISLEDFNNRLNTLSMKYPHPVTEVLWNFLDSHDTARFLTLAGGSKEALRAAVFFQMTYPGVPIIYYGDELGMEGGPDPDCRRPMAWDKAADNETLAYYQSLTRLRKAIPALRYGRFKTWSLEDGIFCYLRVIEEQTALVVLNTTSHRLQRLMKLPPEFAQQSTLEEQLSHDLVRPTLGSLRLRLKPCQGMVFLLVRN